VLVVKYYFAEAGTDKQHGRVVINTKPKCLQGDKQVGGYHTHPDSGGLSGDDLNWARKNGRFGGTWRDRNDNMDTHFATGPLPPLPPFFISFEAGFWAR
jgi:hypothetical protein